MRIIFFVDGNRDIGFGHLNRCFILAQAFCKIEKDLDVEILTTYSKETEMFLNQDTPCKIIWKKKEKEFDLKCDLCIVDKYQYDDVFYNQLKKYANKILIFDDYRFEIPTNVDGIINNNLYVSEKDYSLSSKQKFIGAKYSLLREEFLVKKFIEKEERLLVCMGGGDKEKQTARIVNILLNEVFYKGCIDVVFGNKYDYDDFKKIYLGKNKINIYLNIDFISELMKKAEVCVCGAGSIVYELLHTKTKFACIALSENQILLGKSIAQNQLGLYLGEYNQIEDEEIRHDLLELLNNNCKFNRFKFRGTGSYKLAKDILRWLKK